MIIIFKALRYVYLETFRIIRLFFNNQNQEYLKLYICGIAALQEQKDFRDF